MTFHKAFDNIFRFSNDVVYQLNGRFVQLILIIGTNPAADNHISIHVNNKGAQLVGIKRFNGDNLPLSNYSVIDYKREQLCRVVVLWSNPSV